MKKAFILVILAAMLAVSGCAGENPLMKSKIWEVDINQPGYEPAGVWDPPGMSHIMDWQGEDLRVSITIRAGNAVKARDYEETVEYAGRKFLLFANAVSWDGLDGTFGTIYSRTLRWEQDRFAYSFSAETGNESTSLDIICPENALLAEKGDFSPFKELTLQREFWSGGFKSGEKFIRFELYPSLFSEEMIKNYITGGMTFCKEEGIDFYMSSRERLPDEPNTAAILWNTDAGVICVSGGVPYGERNNVPEDVWDFINPDLARSITEQLGAKILPLP